MSLPIPGLEGLHTWNSQLVLNDKDNFPRYKLRRINGLRSRPESDDNREAKPGRIGEIAYPSLLRGKTVTYEGDIEALTLDSMRRAESDLMLAFGTNEIKQMALTFHPLYPYGAGLAFFYEARCMQCEVPDEQTAGPFTAPSPFKRPFTIGLRLLDPRIYQSTQAGPFSSSAASSTSGITPPFTPPITISGETLGGSITVNNDGTVETDPYFELHGPVVNPIIINETLGKQLAFRNLQLDDPTQFIEVSFKDRTIKYLGTQRPELHDPVLSDWWDEGVPGLGPGTSTLLYRGSGVGVPEMSDQAYMEVSYYHANL